jgi:hypothetical protein
MLKQLKVWYYSSHMDAMTARLQALKTLERDAKREAEKQMLTIWRERKEVNRRLGIAQARVMQNAQTV